MYKKVYNNNKNQAYDLMIRDAMMEADPYLKISERTKSCESYLTLTDFVLEEIKYSKEPGIEKAQKILDDVARRQNVYKHVGDIIVTPEQISKGKITEEQVANYVGSKMSDGNLKKEDIAVLNFKINFALGTKNPVDYVKYYDPSNPEKGSYNIDKSQVSLLISDHS